MGIIFRKTDEIIRFMNPSNDFAPDEIPIEIRFDPLTGQTSRIFDLDYKPPEKPDLTKLAEKTKESFCPFCPEYIEEVTPLFPEELIPEGRIRMGEAIVFPNLLPLDRYPGVCAISKRHYVAIEEFTPEILKNAFKACIALIESVADYDPEVNYFNINWNYLPPAGSSIVHPHLQVNCGRIPTRQFLLQMESSFNYYLENGTDFWNDYIKAEKELKERVIGDIGSTFWTLNYAPQTVLPDFWCLFPYHDTLIGSGDEVLEDFIKGLISAINYFSAEGLYSFNVTMFTGRKSDHFRVNARISPRTLLQKIGNSDQTYYQVLHREPSSMKPPEKIREQVLTFFMDNQ